MPKILIPILITLIWINIIPNQPVSDQIIYDQTARWISEGYGYIDESGNPTAYWAPGYSFYLGFFYYLFSPDPKTAFYANFIIYLFLISGVYCLGKQLYSKKVGALASFLTACYPTFIMYNTIFASEILFITLTVWFLFFALKNRVLISGAILGFAALVRPQALIFPLIFVFKKPRNIVGVTIMMLLVVLPWGLRNKNEMGKFILVSANLGANLLMGNHPNASGGYDYQVLDKKNVGNLNLIQRDSLFKREAIAYIQSHPFEYFILIFKRIYITFRSESIAVVWNQIGITQAIGQWALVPFKIMTNLTYFSLLIAFIFSLSKFQRQDLIILTMIFLLSVPFLFILGQARFHLPLIPFFCLFVSSKINALYKF